MAKHSNIEIRGGRNHTFPVSAGLLEPRHVQAIDASSPWPIYLWFLNRVTRDEANGEQFDGIVLNGKPVGIEQIATELGTGYHICRRHIAHLVHKGYIVQKKTGTGMCAYRVTNSKKWAWQRNGEASGPTEHKVASVTPTEQNLLSGSSADPQSRKCSLDADPQSRICNATEQNLLSAIRKEHRKPHNTKPQESVVLSSKEPPQTEGLFPRVREVEKRSKAKPTSKTKPSAPGTRIPDDFVVTEQHRQFARERDVDADCEFEKFRDYWLGVPGARGRKLDWDATFRNWMRKAVEMVSNNGNGARKNLSRHVGLDKIDYTKGWGKQNADGSFKI